MLRHDTVRGMSLYCNFTCKSSSTLIDSDIYGNLVQSIPNGYLIQLPNSLGWLAWLENRV